ncbi:MAG: sigma-70 family RNA polymerase sigma factor [Balneolaceae bacterium]|nr:sigma-70 family RNA polymerase sigma factor [Balneolaceae bacterium]
MTNKKIANIQHEFGDHLLNFIRSKVSSSEDAQDIYQDVLVKIISRSDQLRNSQSLKSWLFAIARNQIIDHYRAQKRTIDVDDIALNSVSEKDEASAYRELEGCLSGFINQLPDDYQQIITLSEIEGKSQKELAGMLDMNYTTLRSKVQRGRERIKKMIFEACSVEQDASGGFVDCDTKNTSSACGDTNTCGCDDIE